MKKAFTWILLLSCFALTGCFNSSATLQKNPHYAQKVKSLVIIFNMDAFADREKYANKLLTSLTNTFKAQGIRVTVKHDHATNLDPITSKDLEGYQVAMFMKAYYVYSGPYGVSFVKFRILGVDIRQDRKIFEGTLVVDSIRDASEKLVRTFKDEKLL